jgi:hypothetical protein
MDADTFAGICHFVKGLDINLMFLYSHHLKNLGFILFEKRGALEISVQDNVIPYV